LKEHGISGSNVSPEYLAAKSVAEMAVTRVPSDDGVRSGSPPPVGVGSPPLGVSSGGGDFSSSSVGEAEPLVRVGVRVRGVAVLVGVSVDSPSSSPPQASTMNVRLIAASINRRDATSIISASLAGAVRTKHSGAKRIGC
jgi:hypothetical protein